MSEKPEPDVRIEPAGPEHLAEIAALAEVIWRAHYPGIISPEQIDYMLRWMYNVEVMLGEMRAGVFYDRLLIDGVLCGFTAHSRSLGRQWMLHKLYILPQWQRRGLGGRLLDHVSAIAQANNSRSLILRVNKHNTQAIAAYKRHGFKIRKSILNEIGSGFVMDDYVMVKPIKYA